MTYNKTKIIIIIFFLLFASLSFAATISLRWDANSESYCPDDTVETCLVGYRLYNTFSPGSYQEPYPYPLIDIPAGTEEVSIVINDSDADYLYFVVTAHGMCKNESDGLYYPCESGYSNEVNLLDGEEEEEEEKELIDSSPSSGGGSSSGGGCFIITIKRRL